MCCVFDHDAKSLRAEEANGTAIAGRYTSAEIRYYMKARGSEKDKKDEGVALEEPFPRKTQYIVCDESSGT